MSSRGLARCYISKLPSACRAAAQRVALHTSSAVATERAAAGTTTTGKEVKVRFAPSPTGNLHVGGARTALFNWLYAKRVGGKMVLRVEDTDAARSTRESEEAMLRDLEWLGITYDEGPAVGGPNGPYRQSERREIYSAQVQVLVDKGLAYPCFCTDKELEVMKAEAERLKLPPVYRGKWARASAEDVQAAKDAGLPFCYRYRVPPGKEVVVPDMVRGRVVFNTDNLGDFVILRSNGLPVYNFCVAVDDALMGITHVLRAEEHLPNTLRQLLIYEGLGFQAPLFGHMSLILAPDKSKLSKRHGATSVGEFREQGFLRDAMMNYLSLLGWNDGSEKEIYTVPELQELFSIERITKSPAVFDKVKLAWVNGQHLRALPSDQAAMTGFGLAEGPLRWRNFKIQALVKEHLLQKGIVTKADTPFVEGCIALMQNSMELIPDSEREMERFVTYPLAETIASGAADKILEDNFKEIAAYILEQHDSGALQEAASAGTLKKMIKDLGKAKDIKAKRLFMPVRLALTGQLAGPDVAELISTLDKADGESSSPGFASLPKRMELLREWYNSA